MIEKYANTLKELTDRHDLLLSQYVNATGLQSGAIFNEIQDIVSKIKQVTALIEKCHPSDTIRTLDNSTPYSSILAEQENNSESDLLKLAAAFKRSGRKLDYKSSVEEWKEVDRMRSLLYQSFFGDFDHKAKFDLNATAKFSYVIADKIYNTEIITQDIINDVSIIRKQTTESKWQDRALLVSALSLSLVQSKKFDPQKADILLDFISDFEENVWQRAIAGLVVALLANINKWHKHANLKKRLNRLKTIDEVQESLASIEFLLRNEHYKVNFFEKRIFEMDYFKSNPLHFFLPFYKENEILNHCFENSNSEDIGFEDLIEYVTNVPFIDSYKYCLFFGLCDGTTIKVNPGSEHSMTTRFIVNLSFKFYPFHNLLSEYYYFFKYYPAKYIDEFINNQTSIYGTKLKDILLNEFNRLILSADNFLRANNFRQAISELEKAQKLYPNKDVVTYNLGVCYIEAKNYSKARDAFSDLIIKDEEDILARWNLGKSLRLLKEFDQAEKQLNLVYSKKNNYIENLIELALLYNDLKQFPQSLRFLKEAEVVSEKNPNLFNLIANIYYKINDFSSALKYHLQVKEIGPKNKYDNIVNIAQDYEGLGDFELALKYVNKALEMKKNLAYPLMLRGRIYFAGKMGIERAKNDLMQSLKKAKINVIYGNLGHVYLCSNEFEEAIKHYKECVIRFNDIKDFIEKFNKDLHYIKQYEVDEEIYFGIRDQMVEYWKNNEKIMSEDEKVD